MDEQHEIDKPNVNPAQKLPNVTIVHRLALGLTFRWLGFVLGSQRFALALGFMQNGCVGGIDQGEANGLGFGGI